MNLIRKHDEGCIEHNIDRELPECRCEKEKDNWNLADMILNSDIAVSKRVLFADDVKTFIQKVKEDKTDEMIKLSKPFSERDAGYIEGMDYIIEKMNNRAGKL